MSIFTKFKKPVEEWKKRALEHQNFYKATFGLTPYSTYRQCHNIQLKLQLGFALFSSSGTLAQDADDILQYAYSSEQNESINEIYNKIWTLQKNGEVRVAFIFLGALTEELEEVCFPIFRVHQGSNHLFIDTLTRVYKSWSDFIGNNKLPKCLCCFPKGGTYGNNGYDFRESPACEILCEILDNVGAGTAAASSAVGFTAAFVCPVAMPFVVAAGVGAALSSVWSASRSIYTLADRDSHGQSISITDPESRRAYLNLLACSACVISGGATAAAKAGLLGKNVSRATLASCGVASGIVSGLYVLNTCIDIAQRGQLERRDLVNIALGILFFTGNVMNIKAALSLPNPSTAPTADNAEISDFIGKLVSSNMESAGNTVRNNPYVGDFGPPLIAIAAACGIGTVAYGEQPQREAPHMGPVDEFAQTKTRFFGQLLNRITPMDRRLIGGDADLHAVFDHLHEAERVHIFRMIRSQIEGDRFRVILECLLACLRDQRNSPHATELKNVFFCNALKEFLSYVIRDDPTEKMLWVRAMKFLEEK